MTMPFLNLVRPIGMVGKGVGDYGTIVGIDCTETTVIRGELSGADFDNDDLTQKAWG